MNRRRAALIRKKLCEGLSRQEQQEYETLQRLSLESLEQAFPRPSQDDAKEDRPESAPPEKAG